MWQLISSRGRGRWYSRHCRCGHFVWTPKRTELENGKADAWQRNTFLASLPLNSHGHVCLLNHYHFTPFLAKTLLLSHPLLGLLPSYCSASLSGDCARLFPPVGGIGGRSLFPPPPPVGVGGALDGGGGGPTQSMIHVLHCIEHLFSELFKLFS